MGLLAFVFLLFPTGHLLTRRWRAAAWLAAAATGLLTALLLLLSTRVWGHPFNQSSSSSDLNGVVVLAVVFPFLVSLLVAVAATVVRFRRSRGDERLQLKWFVTGGVLVMATFLPAFFAGSSSPPPVLSVLQGLAFMFLFGAIGVAVLKYRLYEIDIVISKAVAYAPWRRCSSRCTSPWWWGSEPPSDRPTVPSSPCWRPR